MQKIFSIILLMLHVTSVCAGVYIDTDLFAYSEPVTIKGAYNNWSGPFRGGGTAFTHNRVETGVTYKTWSLGILKRYDYEMEFSPDTAEFAYRVENKQPLEVGRTYHLDLKARHSYSDGVRLSHQYQPTSNLQLMWGVSYLQGRTLTEGVLKGTVTALAEGDYDFEFDVDYLYSEDVLFDRAVQGPQGEGYSVDLNIDWQPLDDLTTSLTIKDLYGRIYWNNAPRTTATATSSVKEYDEQGFVVFKPALTGFETNENFTQTLPEKTTLLASYRLSQDVHLLARIYNAKAVTLNQLGVEYLLNEVGRLQFLYMLNTDALTLGYKNDYMNFAITSDSTKFSNAHVFGVRFSYLYVF